MSSVIDVSYRVNSLVGAGASNVYEHVIAFTLTAISTNFTYKCSRQVVGRFVAKFKSS